MRFAKKILFFFAIFLYLHSSTLYLSISSNPSRINPILATDSASGEISDWIFNGLFKYDKDGKIIPDLAKSYKFLNKTTLIIKLKQNVKWSDGVNFIAEDVVFTYKTIMSKNIFTPLKSSFRMVKSINALDNYTLKIVYKKPYFKALHIWMVGILPKHLLKDEKNLMTSKFNKSPIGTNYYKLAKFKTSSDIVLVRNELYFDKKPNIKKIIYKFIPDSNTAFNSLKQKKLDVGGLTPLQVDRQIDKKFKKDFNIFEKPSFSYTYLGFNLTLKKFKNKKIREAINLAINKKELIDILFFSHARVCEGPFLPGTFAYNPNIKSEYNPKKAKEILASLGYNKNHPFTFTITTNANNKTRVYAAQIIQYQLSKVNIKVKIKVMEWQAFLNTVVFPRKFEAVLLGWGLSLMPDARSIWHSKSSKKGGFNFIGYKNSEVDRLIEESEVSIDLDKIAKNYKKIYTLIAKDYPYIFLYIPNSITAVNKDIKNVSSSLIGVMHNFSEWIKP